MPAFMNPLAQKISRLRKMRGLTQAQFGEELGVSQSTVSRWEKGEDEPGFEHIMALAQLTGETPEEFAYSGVNTPVTMNATYVIGVVQAGHWVEAVERPRDEWYVISTLPDPEFEGIRHFGLEVEGYSCDKVFPPGSAIECVRFADMGSEPMHEDFVVAIRKCKDGLHEATVKQYIVDESGRPWLIPHSTRPEFQAPIDLTGTLPDDIESVEAWALVIGSYRKHLNPRRRLG